MERLSDLLQSIQTGSPEWETRLAGTTEDLYTMGELVIASPPAFTQQLLSAVFSTNKQIIIFSMS